jgi:hypothetical protein
MRVVIHRPTQTGATVWAETPRRRRTRVLRISPVSDQSLVVVEWLLPAVSDALPADTSAAVVALRMHVREVDGLEPGTRYRVRMHTDGGKGHVVAEFDTLPTALPLTLFAGSCYYADGDVPLPLIGRRPSADKAVDPSISLALLRIYRFLHKVSAALPHRVRAQLFQGRVSLPFRRLWGSPEHTPSVKILLGDQVYVDQPVTYFYQRPWLSQSQVDRRITRAYARSWDGLGWLLRAGGNYCISDDHEFWNDYPNRPHWIWHAMQDSGTLARWKKTSEDFFDHVQQGRSRSTFNIGPAEAPQVSVFIADTRRRRTEIQSTSSHFMADDDFHELTDWVSRLKCPGVLALGQPLLVELGGSGDRNLPSHKGQYAALIRALAAAPHDILLLVGDVHFGRISQLTVGCGTDGPVRTVYEVASSPLAVLEAAAVKSFDISTPTEQIESRIAAILGDDRSVNINHRRAVSARDRVQLCRNHIFSLRLSATPAGVQVQALAHLLQEAPLRGLPPIDVDYCFDLE